MKYKVLEGTKLFDSLMELKKRILYANAASFALMKKMGADHVRMGMQTLGGGLTAVHFSKKKPANFPKGWKRVYKNHLADAYFPQDIKANTGILAEIKALPIVNDEEINKILKFNWLGNDGHDPQSNKICFRPTPHWGPEGTTYILIHLPEFCSRYKPVKDMIEITHAEFTELEKQMTKKKKP